MNIEWFPDLKGAAAAIDRGRFDRAVPADALAQQALDAMGIPDGVVIGIPRPPPEEVFRLAREEAGQLETEARQRAAEAAVAAETARMAQATAEREAREAQDAREAYEAKLEELKVLAADLRADQAAKEDGHDE